MLTNLLDTASPIFPELRSRRNPARSPAFNQPLARAELDMLAAWTREVSDKLKAAAHEGRFLILTLLADGEKSVSELEEITNLSQSVVSQHLARLRYGQLVKARRDGRVVYYSIASAEIPALISALSDLAAPEDRAR